MRVPGAFNWPNAEKEKGGRKKTKSAVMAVHAARTVDFAETRYLEHEGSIHRNRRRAQKARGTGQAISLANIDKPAVIASLEQIGLKETILRAKTIPAGEPDPDGVVEDADREVTVEEPNPLAAAIIGCWPMTPDREEMWKGTDEHGQRIPDRSRVVFAVTHALARRGLNGMVFRLRHGLSLCAGGGGLDMGLMLAEPGYHTRAFVEWEDWPRAVLIAAQRSGYFAPAPIWTDLRSFDARPFRGAFDAVLAGYP